MAEKIIYYPSGLAAIEPSAIGGSFAPIAAPAEPFRIEGSAAVVEICGPLTHSDPQFERYGSIVARVTAALASSAKRVVLSINSPGGDVAGVFEAARAIRAAADAAGKPLFAFTDATCCSSAYALACAADRIFVTDTAVIGSIGVIRPVADITAADAAQGIRITLLTSGARKSDGNPHEPFTDESRAAMQQTVDAMAAVFFAHVTLRRGIAEPAALEAGVFVGAQALAAGVADAISDWGSVVSGAASVSESAILSSAPGAKSPMPNDEPKDKAKAESDDKPKEDALRASLVTASESDDEDKKARAKRALAAYDSDEDGDEPKKDEKPKGASEKPDTSAIAAQSATINALQATVKDLSARVAANAAAEATRAKAAAASERSAFLAARPDLSKELLASLEPLPFDQVKAIVASIPVPETFVNPFVANVAPTLGDTATFPHASAAVEAELDRRTGLVGPTVRAVVDEGNIQRFGVLRAAPKKI